MKSGTYTQFYIQLIFAVKYREAIIHPKFQDEKCINTCQELSIVWDIKH